jgi:hypothetical protein
MEEGDRRAQSREGVPEVRWLPLYTMGCWPLSLGIVTLALSTDADRFAPCAATVAVAVGLFVVGGLQSRRRRVLIPAGEGKLVVSRAGRSGRAFCTARMKVSSAHKGVSLGYALLGAWMIQASTQQLRLGAPLTPGASAGAVAERFTAISAGLFVAVLCAIAIWRRLTCKRVRVPGESRSLWIRASDLPRLG